MSAFSSRWKIRDRSTETATAPSQSRIVTEVGRDAAEALYIWAFLFQKHAAKRKLFEVGAMVLNRAPGSIER